MLTERMRALADGVADGPTLHAQTRRAQRIADLQRRIGDACEMVAEMRRYREQALAIDARPDVVRLMGYAMGRGIDALQRRADELTAELRMIQRSSVDR